MYVYSDIILPSQFGGGKGGETESTQPGTYCIFGLEYQQVLYSWMYVQQYICVHRDRCSASNSEYILHPTWGYIGTYVGGTYLQVSLVTSRYSSLRCIHHLLEYSRPMIVDGDRVLNFITAMQRRLWIYLGTCICQVRSSKCIINKIHGKLQLKIGECT